MAVSWAANFAVDLVVHRNGDSGSPREIGSTSASSAATRSGSVTAIGGGPPPRPPPPPPRNWFLVIQLAHTLRHGIRMHPTGRRDQLDPAPTQHLRLRAEQQPPRPLIQMRADQRQTGGDRIGVHSSQRHTTSVDKPNGKT